ncbi:MAG: EspA/EspE family type VII secretion system effector, partial [Mycobacterium sp.]
QVFGRPPSSAADWETAAALDPHSYDPKNADVPPNIVVGRITPVPGQGVVRMNLFIPAKSVKDPTALPLIFDDNAGDNRGFNPAASPESSRVSLEIDYENGVVVARQNPSANLTTNQVRTGSPTIKVAQRHDGSVYIDYAAADPFSPGGESLAKETVCVKGTIAVQPGADAPRIGGVATSFPALEAYNDRPGAHGVPTTSTVLRMWPADVGQWGPEKGLWWSHDIGDPQVLSDFQGLSGVVPIVPLPTTELGTLSNPASVVMLK